MKVRTLATFTSDLPDDFIEKDGEVVQYGGKSVAEAIGEMLRRLGCQVGPPEYAQEHGWHLYVDAQKRSVWCQVQDIGDEYVFDIRDKTWRLFGKNHPAYVEVLRRLGEELARDPRFHNVLWYTPADYEKDAPGAALPVNDG